MITQTWHKRQTDAKKYGRELRGDCRVKRVASARGPALVKADERLGRKIDACPLNAERYVFIFRFSS